MHQYHWIYVATGGALGSVARFLLAGWVAQRWGEAFPWGTLIINISGSFAIGLAGGLAGPEGRWLASPLIRQFFMIGVCGGFTTFSSFSLQTLKLLETGEWIRASGNIVGSVVLCLIGVWAGQSLAAQFNAMK